MDNTPSFYLDNMGSIPVRRTIIFLVVLLLSCSVCATPKHKSMSIAHYKSVLVFDRTSGIVKQGINYNTVLPIASISKLMAVYVVLSEQLNMDEKITISPHQIETSRVLHPGMQVTRSALVSLALIASDNLAAKMLALSYPRGYDSFIDKMNFNAQRLGMLNTHYIEPTGLLLNMSTAWDLHLLNTELIKYSIYSDAAMSKSADANVQTTHGAWQRFVIHNTNIFAGEYDIRLGKTGFTNPAGFCINMVIRKGNHEFDIIVLGAPNKESRQLAVTSLLHDYMNYITTKSVLQKIEKFDEPDLEIGLRTH
jgi:D-alanyl-D-alanine endopeptidase (penicillin-binding protein 7)